MIFQFNSAEGNGLIMSVDGASHEFSQKHWIDTEHAPSVGLKVSFEKNDTTFNIKVLNENENITSKQEEAETEDKAEEEIQFSSVDEYTQHYQDMGYKLVRDTQNNGIRTAILRRFLEDGHGEMIISCEDSKITLTKFVNGKEVE